MSLRDCLLSARKLSRSPLLLAPRFLEGMTRKLQLIVDSLDSLASLKKCLAIGFSGLLRALNARRQLFVFPLEGSASALGGWILADPYSPGLSSSSTQLPGMTPTVLGRRRYKPKTLVRGKTLELTFWGSRTTQSQRGFPRHTAKVCVIREQCLQ